ncbi:META domain-containing protein [Novosphingobium sp. SL115]|uniref:META domain-containing protein n=1 Tax=Novosphingobium sp. SL115 TaxID=2995150 RepID=UPI00227324A4|nr:META domain-containing protein [Novosphingobium sp. SL115]MCY1669882.1 META domain-containing protein [Novosphingobium sp. SL115]
MVKAYALAVACAALLGGCATAPVTTAGLAGTRWTIVRIDGAPPAAPAQASMRFDDDRLGANVGCNGIGGEYRIEGKRLIAGPLMATRMFCQGPVWQQEEAMNALLSAAPEVQRSGNTLRLVSGGHAVDLALIPPVSPRQ